MREANLEISISTQVIVERAKDLDLLHGLLVYVAWYYSPMKQQGGHVNMLVQIAVAMAIDLDCGKSAQSAAEAKRAFVGTYYLSSCLSMVYKKPVTMKYNDQVGQCCRSLATGNETPSDAELIHFVEMQRLVEEIALVFEHDPMNDERSWIGSERADLLIKTFKLRLQHLRNLFPQDGICLPAILLAYDKTCIYLHQVSLQVSPDINPSAVADADLQPNYSPRINLLIGCLEATKSFLNRYLQLPPKAIEHHSMLEKCLFAEAMMVLIKLSFCTIPGREPFPFRQACNVPYYCDAIGAHIRSISVTSVHAQHHDSCNELNVRAQRIKAWYERASSSEPTIFPEIKPFDLKEPSQLMEIAKEEPLIKFDIGNLDFLFTEEGNNFW